jgi:hypothetical protein
MLIATSTFLQVMFAMLVVVPVTILWFAAVVDVIRHGASGFKIAAVLVLILVLPVIGPLLYFSFRSPEPQSAESAAMAQADLRREVAHRPVGGTGVYR